MPPGSAEFAVGYCLETNIFLLLHDAPDFSILDVTQRLRIDIAGLSAPASQLELVTAQQTAYRISTKGGMGSGHGWSRLASKVSTLCLATHDKTNEYASRWHERYSLCDSTCHQQ
ncbi:hypothetical protein [Modicisalibacter luteus]|uniref:hypothetical protein n=1 Tax=Modicisalibacter luteus TaxID=453962 RepID=UPI003633E3CE